MWVILVLAVVVSVIWVGFDAAEIERQHGRNVTGMRPIEWVIACALLWIVVFPLYLVRRRRVRTEP